MKTMLPAIIGALCGALTAFILMRPKIRQQAQEQAGLGTREKELRNELETTSAELWQTRQALYETREKLAATEATKDSLERQNSSLREQSVKDYNVLRALSPVQEQLKFVQEKVSSLETSGTKQFGEIAEQLRSSQQNERRLLETTRSLESTMRNTKERGVWGELQLQRVVEAAGMIEHIDYEKQTTLNEGRQRPDMIINLPGDKFIIVDAKVPLSSYYQSAQSEMPGQPANYADHAKALRSHIKQLHDKKYWEKQSNSPELVICFLPAESLLARAIEADPGLLDYAFDNHVALASTTTLFATLKAIAFAWKQNVVTNDAKKLLDMADTFYKNLNRLGKNVQRLGENLTTAMNGYNAVVQNLNGHIVTDLRRMADFDPSGLEVEAEIKQLSKKEYGRDDPAALPARREETELRAGPLTYR